MCFLEDREIKRKHKREMSTKQWKTVYIRSSKVDEYMLKLSNLISNQGIQIKMVMN
jgi:hypothetical protein